MKFLISLILATTVTFVDLGVSVRWADRNAGADAPEDAGIRMQWTDAVSASCPSDAEWRELIEKCDWKVERIGERYGMRVTGPNGNSIFLPAIGFYSGSLVSDNKWGYYWSSTTSDFFDDDGFGVIITNTGAYRWTAEPKTMGLGVRPVERK